MASAEETAAMATQCGECVPFAADVTKEETRAPPAPRPSIGSCARNSALDQRI